MDTYLHSLFEQQVELSPDAIALKFQNEEVTYRELNNRSNRLANYLIQLGVKPGDKVALYFERSIEMIVAIMGTLKSGAAYVPISPKAPKGRLDFLLSDLENPIILAGNKNLENKNGKFKIIQLEESSDEPTVAPVVKIDASSTSVILYTSGSTGYPKGVLLSHKSLVNRLIWDRDTYGHSSNDIVLQHASYNFDFSILEIFMALANGGKLILARPEFNYESSYLVDLIQNEKITKMGSVPSLLKAYINLSTFENCTSLKQVFLGGETLHYNLQNLFFKKSAAELINIYGPTEASISVLNWVCKRNDENKIVPIGFPVANMKIYLLGENKQPVADGEAGEIYIAGIGVANGYFKRPELTDKNFLINPFAGNGKELLYRTGDLGKKLPNGAYQFLGRKDSQVKIRGLRIELEEIEYYLNLNENIVSSVVAKIATDEGVDKLAAYVIPIPGSKLDINEIKGSLIKKLPDYMVPSLFVQMGEFPMNINGKVNRDELPYPDKSNLLSNNSYSSAENETQKRLIHIWEQVLKINPIGIKDAFYDIGGDSLAFLEMHHYIEEEFGIKLPLSSLSKSFTIQDQAEIIDFNPLTDNPSKYIRLIRKGVKTPIIFVNPILRSYDSSKLMNRLNPNHPFIETLHFSLNQSFIPVSIEEAARFYVQELEAHYPYSEYIIGGYSMGGHVALEMASILKEKGKSIKLIFLIDTIYPKVLKTLYNNKYLVFKKIKFDLNELVKSDFATKKEMVSRFVNFALRKFHITNQSKNANGTVKAPKALPKFLKEDISQMLLMASKYQPKQYDGSAILISAKRSQDSNNSYSSRRYNKSALDWKNNELKELKIYKMPSAHQLLMEEPNINDVAEKINEHLNLTS